jgi:hypothetical protein
MRDEKNAHRTHKTEEIPMRDDKSRLQEGWPRRALISASSIALLLAVAPVMAQTAIPAVEGPIPVTATSTIFTTGGTVLEAHGYEIEEYLVSGTANVYDWGSDGAATEPQVATADAPYTTRMIVRRPANAADFSGTVWVELNNPSRGWDVEVQWPAIQDKVMRDGDIWVSMTAKPNVNCVAAADRSGTLWPARDDQSAAGRRAGMRTVAG